MHIQKLIEVENWKLLILFFSSKVSKAGSWRWEHNFRHVWMAFFLTCRHITNWITQRQAKKLIEIFSSHFRTWWFIGGSKFLCQFYFHCRFGLTHKCNICTAKKFVTIPKRIYHDLSLNRTCKNRRGSYSNKHTSKKSKTRKFFNLLPCVYLRGYVCMLFAYFLWV